MTPQGKKIQDKMRALIAKQTDAQLFAAITLANDKVAKIGNPADSKNERMVRALLIDEYISRTGEEAGDLLMDTLGI